MLRQDPTVYSCYSSNTYRVSLGNFGKCIDNERGALLCSDKQSALLHFTGQQKTFLQLPQMDVDSLRFNSSKQVSAESCRDIMNSPISNIKEKRNAFAELLNASFRLSQDIPSPYDQIRCYG